MNKLILGLLLLLGAVAGAGGCKGSKAGAPAATAEREPTRRSLIRNARRASVWRFVYCLEAGQSPDELIKLLANIADQQPFGKRVEVVNCDEVDTDTLGAGPVTLFGSRLPDYERLPLQTTPGGYRFDDRLDLLAEDVLFLPYYRNPWGKGATVSGVFLSRDPARLTGKLTEEYGNNWDRMFWNNWAYEIHRAGGDRVYGAWRDTSWRFDAGREIALDSPDVPVYDSTGLRIYAYDGVLPRSEVERIAVLLRDLRGLIDSLGEQPRTTYPEIRLYPTLERIGLRTGNMNPVQFDAAKDILHLVPTFLNYAELQASATIWAMLLGGDDSEADELRRIARLQLRARNSLEDEVLLAEWNALRLKGDDVWAPGEERTSQYLERARIFRELLREEETTSLPVPALASINKPDPPLAGMTFAHEGYRMHNGYGGEKIVSSLDSLGELNVNAVAIVPYTFMRNADQPTALFIPNRGGSENDWSVIRSIREARVRGWSVLLKPQIWLGGDSWPGDVGFATEAEWDRWFAGYKYWITHYALLAQQERVTALCLGTELVKTTLTHPEHWRDIIRTVRKVYGGQLTYAANWGEEFENFSFWKDLDAIGLNSYYPLSDKDQPTDEDLLDGARRWFTMAAKVSQRNDRPLWLTEVGFRSVERAWVNPHAEPNDRPADLTAQARSYRALLQAAAATPELQGMFVWKWPSYLGRNTYRGERVGFTPGGKPAADELERFYGDWTER